MSEGSRRVFLMGIKHSGKSTLGTMLARHLRCPFIDLDDAILELFAPTHRGIVTTVRDVYRALGVQGFQRIEAQAAQRLIETTPPGDARQVVALGGGTIENETAMRHLDGNGVFLYLQQEEQTLYRRIAAGGIPPFLDSADPEGSFHALFQRRDGLYRRRADYVVDIRNMNIAESLKAVIRTGVIQAGER